MSQPEFFSDSCLCSHQTGCPHFPEVRLLPLLRSSFLQVPYTWISKMISHVGYSGLLFSWTWGSSDLFLIFKGLSFPSAFDVEAITLFGDGLLLSFWYIIPIWLKPSKYCATWSLDAALWRFLTTSSDVSHSLGGGGYPRLAASAATLLSIKLYIAVLAWSRSY